VQIGPYASCLVNAHVQNVFDVSFNFENNTHSGHCNKFDTSTTAGIAFEEKSYSLGYRYDFEIVRVG
jgi:hypothetical protein